VDVICKIIAFFDNRTTAPAIGSSKMAPQAIAEPCNSHVSKILPLTTFRTIDLAGGRISDPLFSGSWAETRVFFQAFYAPEYVQS
jgi:hypothetical protein